jgi:hypothetical protein
VGFAVNTALQPRRQPSRSFTLKKEHRLRMFENRLLRKIFGIKRKDITGSWEIA